MLKIELLAPAKDLDCGISAINCGADAVYIGAPRFGARSAAGNTFEDIAQLIEYAHRYYAKVYITVNTILTDEELSLAGELIEKLYALKADGIIIQDTGLLELDLPPIPLIASTQMNNVSVEKIKFLEQAGIKRVILARELSLEQIKTISENVSVELEAFIHGALCVSYSGQCYLSYAIGGRSGNRGECAQPCRKKYTLKDSNGQEIAEDQYLLSLKDMNRSQYIEDMINAGITSFKIEGRLKDSNYIKNIVSYYRQEIDKVLQKLNLKKASSGKVEINFTPDPLKTFNRGYTDYFIKSRSKDIASPYTPKSLGEPMGKIKKLSENYFTISSDKQLSAGDGICFFSKKNVLYGTTINNVINEKIFPKEMDQLFEGQMIYRNHDIKFLKELKAAKIRRSIDIKLLVADSNVGITVSASDEDGNTAEVFISAPDEVSKNKDLIVNNFRKQLSKLGDSEFSASDISIDFKHYYFIPVKDINALRRQLTENLRTVREKNRPQEKISIVPNNIQFPQKDLDFSANVFNKAAERFYRRHGVENIEPAAETMKKLDGKKVMTTRHCLKYHFNTCKKESCKNKFVEPLFLVDEEGKHYQLNFDCKNCVMEIIF